MKIELENGSAIETIDSKDSIRSRRAKLWELLNAQYERKLTEDEEKVIELFMAKPIDTESFKKEYDCICVSSSEEEGNKNES